jgi:undecaprenyl-diphosphatase
VNFFERLAERERPLLLFLAAQERRRWFRAWMLFSTRGADGWALMVIVPLLFLLDSSRGLAGLAYGVVSGVATALLVSGLKNGLKRKRPRSVGLERPITAPDVHAFPSGHTSQSCSVLVMAFWFAPWLGFALLPLVLGVALSRMFFGLHHPSDVLAGAFLGSGLAAATLTMAIRWNFVDWLMRSGPLG